MARCTRALPAASNFQLTTGRVASAYAPSKRPTKRVPPRNSRLAIRIRHTYICTYMYVHMCVVKCWARNCTPTQTELRPCPTTPNSIPRPHPHPHPQLQLHSQLQLQLPTRDVCSARANFCGAFNFYSRFVFTWFLHINTNIHIQINKVYSYSRVDQCDYILCYICLVNGSLF